MTTQHDPMACQCGTCKQAWDAAFKLIDKNFDAFFVGPQEANGEPCNVWAWHVATAILSIAESVSIMSGVKSGLFFTEKEMIKVMTTAEEQVSRNVRGNRSYEDPRLAAVFEVYQQRAAEVLANKK